MLRYAEAVCKEIAARKADVAGNATIYFGGGTPSLLPLSGIADIVTALKQYGFWRRPAEATIECNPGTADGEKLSAYREMGFDRISFGVQSFNDNELKTIGRIHNAEAALDAIKTAKDVGFERINADLMYGLPGQTLESLEQSLVQMAALDLEHISVYGLILEEGTPLERLVTAGRMVLPEDEIVDGMYDLVMGYLPRAGYERYEISNFAKAGGYSRHNLVYWNYLPYLGFGAGATGFDGLSRRRGVESIEKYIEDPLSAEVEELSAEDIFSEYLFMNLRKREGVSLPEFRRRYQGVLKNFDFAGHFDKIRKKLQGAEYGELVRFKDDDRFSLTERGFALGNRVFLECLED